MAGLLDVFGTGGLDSLGLLGMSAEDVKRARDDAQAQAMFALAGRLFQGGNTGASIAEGLQMGQKAYKGALQGELADKLQTAQIQDMVRKQQEATAAKAREAAVQKAIAGAYTPEQATYGNLTPQQIEQAGAGLIPVQKQVTAPASFDISRVAPALMAIPEGRKALKELAPEFKGVGDYLYQIPLVGAPTQVAGAPKMTSDMQGYKLAQEQGFKGTFMDYQAASKKPLVVMNEGQKGFENTTALRKQFQSEPIYKEFQDLGLAYNQVTNAIKAGTPIGDTAAATKIMKLLDPGSVVRETELGMAMAATGKIDRLKNYFDLYVSGRKLTDTQRLDFQNLANDLYAAGQQAYNKKRKEYEILGQSFGLNTDVALGESARGIGLPAGVKVTKE